MSRYVDDEWTLNKGRIGMGVSSLDPPSRAELTLTDHVIVSN